MHKELIQTALATAEFGISQAWYTKSDVVKLLEVAIKDRQSEIDRLMLEFCPERMTDEQLRAWENAQVPVSKEEYNRVCRNLGFPEL